jgi:hypothetical protein
MLTSIGKGRKTRLNTHVDINWEDTKSKYLFPTEYQASPQFCISHTPHIDTVTPLKGEVHPFITQFIREFCCSQLAHLAHNYYQIYL